MADKPKQEAPKTQDASAKTDEIPTGQSVAREMMDAYAEFHKSLGEVDKSLVDHYREAQKSATEAYTEYMVKVQSDWSKPDAANEAAKAYSARLQEIQSAFQTKWIELFQHSAKDKADRYREYVRKVHAAWCQLPVEQLTPAEAVNIGQSLAGVAALSQVFGGVR